MSTGDILKVEESRSAFGYRKPSSEYRVVDFLADAYGFSRKNTFNFPTSTTTTTTSAPVTTVATVTTTSAPATIAPLRLASARTTTSVDYSDESDADDDDTPMPSPPPPAPLRLLPSKTSPASHARFSSEQVKLDMDSDSDDEQRKDIFPSSPGRQMKQTSSLKDRQIEQEREREETTTTSPTTASPLLGALKTSGRLIQFKGTKGTTVTPTAAPQVDLEGKGNSRQPNEDSALITESMRNRISIHQLVSESMPSVSMSIVPVYFVNRVTKSVITVPYLTMKSVSKMPLLPGMYGDATGSASSMSNLLRLQSHRIQRSNFKSGHSLFKLLQSESATSPVNVNSANSNQMFDEDKGESSEAAIKSLTSSKSAGESDWIPINVNNNPISGVTTISDPW